MMTWFASKPRTLFSNWSVHCGADCHNRSEGVCLPQGLVFIHHINTMAEPVRRLLEVCKDTSSALGIPVVAPILTAVFSSMNKVLEEAKVGSPSQSTRQEADPVARIVAQRQG
jgi:hypothetical protein